MWSGSQLGKLGFRPRTIRCLNLLRPAQLAILGLLLLDRYDNVVAAQNKRKDAAAQEIDPDVQYVQFNFTSCGLHPDSPSSSPSASPSPSPVAQTASTSGSGPASASASAASGAGSTSGPGSGDFQNDDYYNINKESCVSYVDKFVPVSDFSESATHFSFVSAWVSKDVTNNDRALVTSQFLGFAVVSLQVGSKFVEKVRSVVWWWHKQYSTGRNGLVALFLPLLMLTSVGCIQVLTMVVSVSKRVMRA